MPRRGITVYLPPVLETKVEKIARDQHRSASSLITEAVRLRFGRHDLSLPQELPPGFITRIDARLDKTIAETLIVKEATLLFIRVWLEHHPPLDEEHEESAAASAEARFERFLQLVANGLGASRRSVAGALGAEETPPSDERS